MEGGVTELHASPGFIPVLSSLVGCLGVFRGSFVVVVVEGGWWCGAAADTERLPVKTEWTDGSVRWICGGSWENPGPSSPAGGLKTSP